MGSTFDERLSMTVWPGVRLPTPRLSGAQYELSQDGRWFSWTGGYAFASVDEARAMSERRRDVETSEVGEIYLELLQLDLWDDQAVMTFVNRFGILGVAYNDYELIRAYPGFEKARPLLGDTTSPGTSSHETVSAFRYGALCIRDLVRAYDYLAEGLTGEIAWESLDSVFSPAEREEIARRGFPVTSEAQAQSLLARGLSAGLQPFYPRLQTSSEPLWLVGLSLPLYAVCCRELHNHIIEHATRRHCARANCQSTFVRQRGTAKMNQHRTVGVIYCSRWCAEAEASRRYRAKKRASRAEPAS
jgi:hypothetical protein